MQKNSRTYYATIEDTATCRLIRFVDFPEALTFVPLGSSQAEAATVALDCVRTAIHSRFKDQESLPPSTSDYPRVDAKHRLIITLTIPDSREVPAKG